MATGIILDLDRTLVDVQTYTDYESAVAELPADLAHAPADTPATEWRSATRRAMDVLVATSGTGRWQAISDHLERFEVAAVPDSDLMPGVFDFLAAIVGRPVAVVTLMGPGAARAALAHHNIHLPLVLGRVAEHRPKPAPDQLLDACSRIGVAPADAVMIGDSTWDAASATAAGCDFIGLTLTKPNEFDPGTTTVDWLHETIPLLRR